MAEFNNIFCSSVLIEETFGKSHTFFDMWLSFECDSMNILDILGKERCMEYFDLVEKDND